MATTMIMSVHVNKGKTARQCITDRLNYIMNPDKTDGGLLISSHACAPPTAADEFLLYRSEYQRNTGRSNEHEVIAYHVRQAFRPGEVSPEEANRIGMELARRMTDDQHAYVVATHVDKHHPHNHIVICSTDLECHHKYRDAKKSARDIMRISDEICMEHGLSVVQDPQNQSQSYDKWQGDQKKITQRDSLRMTIDAALRHQPDGFDALMQMLEEAGYRIKRGSHVSVKPPDGERYIRLKSLGPEYDEQSLRRTLTGEHVHIPRIPRSEYTEPQVKRLVDIEKKLREGKGKGYQVWAERNNIDAKAQSVIYLKEHHIGSISELENQIQTLESEKNEMISSIRDKRNRIKSISEQRRAIRDYGRTKEVYAQYRESGWSSEFYNDHREEIDKHKQAQTVYAQYDGKLPTLKELTADYNFLREQIREEKTSLEQLKPELTNLKHIRYNFDLILRDTDPDTKKRHRADREER
ncbi:MAG: relaxase/mobilization nuclease domain-containing protein [Oscillospiraceae bacterium]|nr:relaxase/mobilization nuclease domain-containing protein [Oscillospiraceae bacterium]